jgi:hypothetical protein
VDISPNTSHTGCVYWRPGPELYKPYLRNRIKRGLGIGQGLQYQSFLSVRDVPSKGHTHTIQGSKIPRRFLLLSDFEATHFLLRERDPNVIDIRENFPILDIDWTMEACARLGIRHHYKNGYPFPCTLDFVISMVGEIPERVETVKVPNDAANEEVRKRLSVEANWCRSRPKVPYVLVDTSAYVSKQLLSTLLFMRAWTLQRYESDGRREAAFERAYSSAHERNAPLTELMQNVAKTMRIQEHLALDMFRFCAWHDQIPVSLKHPLAMNLPVIMR